MGCLWTMAGLLGLMALAPHPAELGALAAAAAVTGPVWNVAMQVTRMRLVPNDLLGRASSVSFQLSRGIIPLGSLASGLVLQALGPARTVAVLAGAMALAAAATTAAPAIRTADSS